MVVLVFLAEGFEEIEALTTIDILRRAGLDVRSVGVNGTVIRGAHGITVMTDLSDRKIPETGLQAIVLPGGCPGTQHLEESDTVLSFLDKAQAAGCLLCAICAAPSILGHKGFLRGKKATCYPGYESSLKGARLCGEPVVRDNGVITAAGAGVTVDFALAIVTQLVSPQKADSIREAIQCR